MEQRKRKLSQPAKKCSIGQPKSLCHSDQPCELCRGGVMAAFERNSFFGKEADRLRVLRICGGCNGILDKLYTFRKQALCSSKFLLNPSGDDDVRPRICRFCFVTGDGLVEMFDERGGALDLKLLEQMRDWLEILLNPRDSVTKLCGSCILGVKALAVLGIGPATDIVYVKKSLPSKPKVSKKAQREKRDAREESDQRLLQLLQEPREGRNFTVRTADVDPRVQVVFEEYFFRLFKCHPDGTSAWRCVHNRLRSCAAEIGIDSGGTVATLKDKHHNHGTGAEKLLEYRQGKGRTRVDGVEQSFWLTFGASGKSPYTRALWLDGYRFYLVSIGRGGGTGSKWCCNRSWDTGCRVLLTVEGIFEEIKRCGTEHTHDPYPEAKIERYLQDCGVDLEVEDSREVDTASVELNRSQNFTMKLTVDQKVQITVNGHDFQWEDEAASWCCVWREIRRCPVQIQLSPDGKEATLVDTTSEHNHPDEVVAIFWQKFGKNLISDEHENNDFYYRLSGKSEDQLNRRIVYQGYRYQLAFIADNGDSDWKCEQCQATVRVMGLFWIIDYRCLHSHAPLTLEQLDYDQDLLPYKSTNPTANIPQPPSALLNLLSVDEPERNFQMHHHENLMKILQDGYEYSYCCSKPSYSLWKCFYATIRGCGAILHVDNHGRIGTPAPTSTHNHSIELWDLYYHRLGEATIRNESTNAPTPFVFLIKPDFLRPLPHIIYQGHLFTMIFITELGERSKWRCVGPDCGVTANVTGLFEAIVVEGLPHCEEPLREEEKREWIGRYGTPDDF
ncbi:uncharacterized protein LOC120412423 [Culex pipiens pallens]|uniref:uncharacterized protein LOC120412423 n=1 Tax=Culex pipiens pallens TaxID=42434 RepID=UPI0019545BBA|nr:uncharacterized protein LOC120412423 [Culex pipiens pallens]